MHQHLPPHHPARAPEPTPPVWTRHAGLDPASSEPTNAGPRTSTGEDQRQGVTFTQHATLDLLDQRERLWSELTVDQQIEQARIAAFDARNFHSAAYKHAKLVEAAARLLDVAERVAVEALCG